MTQQFEIQYLTVAFFLLKSIKTEVRFAAQ